MRKKHFNRRKFLGTASCAAVGSTTFFSTLFNLQSLNAASVNNMLMPGEDDYKALVCIMLGGGNDSFNMLIPSDPEHYQEYAATRSNLAIAQKDLLKINPLKYKKKVLSFHPSAPELQKLFNEEKLAVVTNVGTLVERVKKSTYDNGAKLPNGLFSHADQDKQWLTSIPQTAASTGWGGRLSDMIHTANSNQDISMNISLSGKNIFQLGKKTAEYSILPTGSIGIDGYDGANTFDQIRTAAVKSLMEKKYQDIFRQSYADVMSESQEIHELFSAAVGDSEVSTAFSASGLSQRLKMVAKTMKARKKLGMKRQTFFIRYDGWDHHDELLNNHSGMLGVVSKAMSEFQASLEELDLQENVTTFTVSDFSRTLTSNGNGTDHAWGGNALVMGGKVNGKEVYGDYPSLNLKSDLMLEGGVIIPQISTDEYFAELALWYGASSSDLETLLPNITNFFSPVKGNQPLGFMNI